MEQTNIGYADYVVHIKSLWEDVGEKSTTTEHKGTLKDAIKNAVAEFEAINHRHDDQRDCSVEILLGNKVYPIPKEYWQKFLEN